jgi:CH domain-containing protein
MADIAPSSPGLAKTLLHLAYDLYNNERYILTWLESVSGIEITREQFKCRAAVVSGGLFGLADGVALCAAVNAAKPGACDAAHPAPVRTAYERLENLSLFRDACGKLGISADERVSLLDMEKGRRAGKVARALVAFARVLASRGVSPSIDDVADSMGRCTCVLTIRRDYYHIPARLSLVVRTGRS